jgi:hypothetical protein
LRNQGRQRLAESLVSLLQQRGHGSLPGPDVEHSDRLRALPRENESQ